MRLGEGEVVYKYWNIFSAVTLSTPPPWSLTLIVMSISDWQTNTCTIMSGPWHLFKMIHLDWRQFLQVIPVVLNSGLHGVLHHFKGHMVDVGGDVDHSDPKKTYS